MKPVPLSEKQIEKIISNLVPDIQEKYELCTRLIKDEDAYDENDELISKDVKEKYIQELTEELG